MMQWQEGGAPVLERLETALATKACHGSIRAGRIMSKFEMQELLEELDEVDFSVCAHGRPVASRETPQNLKTVSSNISCSSVYQIVHLSFTRKDCRGTHGCIGHRGSNSRWQVTVGIGHSQEDTSTYCECRCDDHLS